MLSLGNGEYCHKDSFANTFVMRDSILDFIPETDHIWADGMNYKELRESILLCARKLASIKNSSIYPAISGKDFVIAMLAGLLADKAVITHEKMIMADDTLVFNGLDEIERIVTDDAHSNRTEWNVSSGYVMFFTSGSTDRPKLVRLNQTNLIYGSLGCLKDELQTIPEEKILLCLPRCHVYEVIMELMFTFSGVTLIFSDIGTLYPSYMRHKPTIMVLVPQILNAFYEKKLPLQLRILISGGAPMRSEVWEFYHKTCPIIANGYGSTESSASIAVSTDGTTNGTCTKGVIVKISDDRELLVKGKTISSDYVSTDGWYHTHDIATIIDGKIKLLGRDNRIIKLQQGEYINLDKLSSIYSKKFTVVVHATSLDRYPSAIVFVPDELIEYANEEDILSELQKISILENLKGFERIEKIQLKPASEVILLENMKIDYESIRNKFT